MNAQSDDQKDLISTRPFSDLSNATPTMADTAPRVPAPYDRAGLSDPRNRVLKSFQRIYRTTQQWPWEWLPRHFNPRPEDWNINCSEKLALVVDLVCEESSLVSLDELRDFLVDRYQKSHQCQDESAGQPARLAADCKLARKWITETQHDRKPTRKLAGTVQIPGSTIQTAYMGPDDNNNDSEGESDTDILNVPDDFPTLGYDHEIYSRRSFAPTEPEPDVETTLSPINPGPAPNHQESFPRKRTRYEAGLDSACDTGPNGLLSSQDVNADAEMSRIEPSDRISIERKIQTIKGNIKHFGAVKALCLEELEERQHAAEHLGAEKKDEAHRLAVESLKKAQDQHKEAESFMKSMEDEVARRGCECPKPYHDAYNESIREVMEAAKKHERAKKYLQALEDEIKDDRERYAEALERIESLGESIHEYDQIISNDTKEKRALLARLVALDILSCRNLDVVPTETLEMFCSSANGVLEYANRATSEM